MRLVNRLSGVNARDLYALLLPLIAVLSALALGVAGLTFAWYIDRFLT